MSEFEHRRVTVAQPKTVLQETPGPEFQIQVTIDKIVTVKKQVFLNIFFLIGRFFETIFLIIPTRRTLLISLFFFEKHSVTLDIENT